jgi:hypothetical protein
MKVIVTEQSNPLDFYKNNRELLHRLGNFSKIVFSNTTTSTPSEEDFSTAGNKVSDQRSSLTSTNAEELVLISQNKRLGEHFGLYYASFLNKNIIKKTLNNSLNRKKS